MKIHILEMVFPLKHLKRHFGAPMYHRWSKVDTLERLQPGLMHVVTVHLESAIQAQLTIHI